MKIPVLIILPVFATTLTFAHNREVIFPLRDDSQLFIAMIIKAVAFPPAPIGGKHATTVLIADLSGDKQQIVTGSATVILPDGRPSSRAGIENIALVLTIGSSTIEHPRVIPLKGYGTTRLLL